jgi:hypothetical protein
MKIVVAAPPLPAEHVLVDGFVRILRAKEADPSKTPLRDIIRVFDSVARRPILSRATGDAGVALDFQRRHPEFVPYRYEDFVRSDFGTIESCLGFAVAPGTASVPGPASFPSMARPMCCDWSASGAA